MFEFVVCYRLRVQYLSTALTITSSSLVHPFELSTNAENNQMIKNKIYKDEKTYYAVGMET